MEAGFGEADSQTKSNACAIEFNADMFVRAFVLSGWMHEMLGRSFEQSLDLRDGSRKDGTTHQKHQFRLTFKAIAVALLNIALYAKNYCIEKTYLKCSEYHYK